MPHTDPTWSQYLVAGLIVTAPFVPLIVRGLADIFQSDPISNDASEHTRNLIARYSDKPRPHSSLTS